MKERPILFSASMVRAILAGTKTQTRRVVKPRKDCNIGCQLAPHELAGEANGGDFSNAYCVPGDRLWVRETWMPDPPCDGTWGYTAWAGCRLGQIAAVPERFRRTEFCNYRASWPHKDHGFVWTPAIHMPRWASRILLEVVSVRVERLQDISDADAFAEGVGFLPIETRRATPRCDFIALWESINGPGSWDRNDWVWVVEFRRIEGGAA